MIIDQKMQTGLAKSAGLDDMQINKQLAWLRRLPQLPPEQWPDMQAVEAYVNSMTQPANPAWCMARVAALLCPYFDKTTQQYVREIEAEDWLCALAAFPQWAIERAARWWKSDENPDRRKRPLEGDITARCRHEMGGITTLTIRLQWIKRTAKHPETPRKSITKAELERRANLANQLLGKSTFAKAIKAAST